MANYHSNAETAVQVVELGVKKCSTSFERTVVLGIMGGVFIGIGYAAALTAVGADPNLSPLVARYLGATMFPVGLMLTVLVGGDLFTGDVLSTLAWLDRRVSTAALLKVWAGSWIGNLIGASLTAVAFAHSGALSPEVVAATVKLATHKAHLSWSQVLVSACLCNVLVALAVWMSLAAKDVTGKLLAIYFPIQLFVLLGFQHVVANFFLFPLAAVAGGASFEPLGLSAFFLWNTVGNALSGGVLLPLVYWWLFVKPAPLPATDHATQAPKAATASMNAVATDS